MGLGNRDRLGVGFYGLDGRYGLYGRFRRAGGEGVRANGKTIRMDKGRYSGRGVTEVRGSEGGSGNSGLQAR
jgi:hypothetical protein